MLKLKALLLVSFAVLFIGCATAQMPALEKSGFAPTLNKYGWMATKLDPFSLAFIEFSRTQTLPVLDLGTAYGFTSSLLLKQGNQVIANDIDERHLSVLWKETPPKLRHLLVLDTKRFPDQTTFESNSLSAVLSCRVFHFLRGQELEVGVRKIHDWLAPGGKVFVVANAPYRKNLKAFAKQYDEQKSTVRYPGEVERLSELHPEYAKQLPEFFHYLDADVLKRLFTEAGFIVEKVEYFKLDSLSDEIRWDGRENVGLIATKPITLQTIYKEDALKCSAIPCIRKEIDRINDEILQLLTERTAYLQRAGDLKLHSKIANDPKRVDEIFKAITAKSELFGLPKEIGLAAFKAIIANSIEFEQNYINRKLNSHEL